MQSSLRPTALLVLALMLGAAGVGSPSAPLAEAAPGPDSAESGPSREPRFAWPLAPTPRVVGSFDPPATDYGRGHRGVDLAARPGQRVLAAAAGVVVFAGPLAGRGVVSIQHESGLRTTYEPVRANVTKGTRVHPGEVIGTAVAGHPDCSSSACLHWGVRSGADYLDPLMLVRDGVVVRLKPWEGG